MSTLVSYPEDTHNCLEKNCAVDSGFLWWSLVLLEDKDLQIRHECSGARLETGLSFAPLRSVMVGAVAGVRAVPALLTEGP